MNITLHTAAVDGGPFACHPARSWSVPEHRVLTNNVVLPWEYDDRDVRAWLLWDDHGALGVVWATDAEDAFDIARDAGLFAADDDGVAQARNLRELAACDAKCASRTTGVTPEREAVYAQFLALWRERRAQALAALPAMTYRIGKPGEVGLRYVAGSVRLFLGQDPGFAFYARVPSQELNGHRLHVRGADWLVVQADQLIIRTAGSAELVEQHLASAVYPSTAGNLLCVRLDHEDIAVAAQAYATHHREAAGPDAVHMAPLHLDPSRDYKLLCRFAGCRGAQRPTLEI